MSNIKIISIFGVSAIILSIAILYIYTQKMQAIETKYELKRASEEREIAHIIRLSDAAKRILKKSIVDSVKTSDDSLVLNFSTK